ncbi:MAG: hypothetical protein JO327_06315 [Nitrososphaeraceae archaeon]|nr:hypothetical protein [Nitrososphaeraceae archaeon]
MFTQILEGKKGFTTAIIAASALSILQAVEFPIFTLRVHGYFDNSIPIRRRR